MSDGDREQKGQEASAAPQGQDADDAAAKKPDNDWESAIAPGYPRGHFMEIIAHYPIRPLAPGEKPHRPVVIPVPPDEWEKLLENESRKARIRVEKRRRRRIKDKLRGITRD